MIIFVEVMVFEDFFDWFLLIIISSLRLIKRNFSIFVYKIGKIN